jgi:ATP-binding cassette subfamily B protein
VSAPQQHRGAILRLAAAESRARLAFAICLATLSALLGFAIPPLVGVATQQISQGRGDALATLVIAIAGAGILAAAAGAGAFWLSAGLGAGVESALRRRVVRGLHALPLDELHRYSPSTLVALGGAEIAVVRTFVATNLPMIVQAGVGLVLAATILMIADPPLAALGLCPLLANVWVMWRYADRVRARYSTLRDRLFAAARIATETALGIRVVKAFARERERLERHRAARHDALVAADDLSVIHARLITAVSALPGVGLVAVLLLGGARTIDGAMSIGELTTFYVYLLMLSGPAQQLGASLDQRARALSAMDRMQDIVGPFFPRDAGSPESEPENGTADRRPAPVTSGVVTGNPALSFDAVSVRLGDATVLRGVDLELRPPAIVAVTGPSGSGKSTLLALPNRLIEPSHGHVRLDDTNVTVIPAPALTHVVSASWDDPVLMRSTIREAIALGRPDATDEEVVAAARLAEADEFIIRLAKGYDTEVGDRGLTLSGGQRQRIALARALLMSPRVLLLDDALSALDPETEQTVLDAIRKINGALVVIASSRPASVSIADRVVSMRAGRVEAVRDRHPQDPR